MKNDVIDNPIYKNDLNDLRSTMRRYMKSLNDEFHECTWYRDFWMYKNFSIKSSAKGEFGPLPPIEPFRV